MNAMTQTTRPRGRPPKYPPEEVRRRLLDAARDRLKEEGVESGLDAVTLDGAIVDADVPRGMAYRIWQDDDRTPQDEFRRATVVDLLSIPATAGLPATRKVFEKFLTDHADILRDGTLHERKQLFCESIRVVGGFNYDSLANSDNWKLYMALRTAAITRPHVDPALVEVLIAGEDYLIEKYSELYRYVADAFRIQIREGVTMAHFAAAAYAVNEGIATRMTSTPSRTGIPLPDATGEVKEWTLFAIALEAITDRFFEWLE